MNTLSWLIYAAEVTGNLRELMILGTALGVMAIGVAAFVAGLLEACGNWPEGCWKKPFRWTWAVALAALVATAIPSSRTIYMIAASEAGEQIATSPDAIEMMGDLKAVIKKKLKEELAD
ncbi:MAG: hypothetical protein AB7I42_25055 [Bradyrhizobium sp.]|uniref:hypothetical protein n=1 Tax=Bradyrhizobium sp. TaxID=376 RepID=UPI003D105C07